RGLGTGRCETAGAGRTAEPSAGWIPPSPGFRWRPPRLCLARVERGNPDGVRAGFLRGGLTVRKVDPSAGTGWPRSECRCAERRRETGGIVAATPVAAPG